MVGDILYSPGISFKNPKLTKISAPVRTRPWFYQETAVGPLSAVNKIKRADLSNSKVLRPYQAVWQRSALQRNTDNIGAYFQSVPSPQQLGLGEAPATSITTTTNRDPLGFLTNLVSTIGNTGSSVLTSLQKQQDAKAQTAMATVQAYTNQMVQGAADNKMPLILGGVAVAGLIGWYLLRR